MKLSATMFLTLDGVYQGQGGADEDRRGGFERGGWVALHPDEEIWPYIQSVYERADAFLLGRVTWEVWARYWPFHDAGDHAVWVGEVRALSAHPGRPLLHHAGEYRRLEGGPRSGKPGGDRI